MSSGDVVARYMILYQLIGTQQCLNGVGRKQKILHLLGG